MFLGAAAAAFSFRKHEITTLPSIIEFITPLEKVFGGRLNEHTLPRQGEGLLGSREARGPGGACPPPGSRY